MKSVHAQLLDRTDFQFGHQHSKTTLFVPITGTNGTNMIHALCQQLPPDARCVSSINCWSHGLQTYYQRWHNVKKKKLTNDSYDTDGCATKERGQTWRPDSNSSALPVTPWRRRLTNEDNCLGLVKGGGTFIDVGAVTERPARNWHHRTSSFKLRLPFSP